MKNEELTIGKRSSASKGKANGLAHTLLLIVICFMASMTPAMAQQNSGRISLGFGCLYERGLDVTLSYEHETKYHNAWEYFANGYIKWDECASCGHVCPESFWNNYRSYGFGIAYKPCVARGRNHMATCASEHLQAVIPTGSWAASTSAMNITTPCATAGNFFGR